MPSSSTRRTGVFHFKLMENSGATRILTIPVELNERYARDVCAFINEHESYELIIADCWLSNVAGGEPVSAESLSSSPTPAGDDSSSVKDRMGWPWRRIESDLRSNKD